MNGGHWQFAATNWTRSAQQHWPVRSELLLMVPQSVNPNPSQRKAGGHLQKVPGPRLRPYRPPGTQNLPKTTRPHHDQLQLMKQTLVTCSLARARDTPALMNTRSCPASAPRRVTPTAWAEQQARTGDRLALRRPWGFPPAVVTRGPWLGLNLETPRTLTTRASDHLPLPVVPTRGRVTRRTPPTRRNHLLPQSLPQRAQRQRPPPHYHFSTAFTPCLHLPPSTTCRCISSCSCRLRTTPVPNGL